MPIELRMLVWAVVLTLVQLTAGVLLTQRRVPLVTLVGNREDMPEVGGVAGRALRAHRNMLEILAPFAALVLAVVFTARTTTGTAIGAELFVVARVGFAIVYVAGIPWVRTAFWLAALGALTPFLTALLS